MSLVAERMVDSRGGVWLVMDWREAAGDALERWRRGRGWASTVASTQVWVSPAGAVYVLDCVNADARLLIGARCAGRLAEARASRAGRRGRTL